MSKNNWYSHDWNNTHMPSPQMIRILLDLADHMIFLSISHYLDTICYCSKLIFESLIYLLRFTLEQAVSQQQNMSHVDWCTLQLQSPMFVLYDKIVVSDDEVSIVNFTDKLYDRLRKMQTNIVINRILDLFFSISFFLFYYLEEFV